MHIMPISAAASSLAVNPLGAISSATARCTRPALVLAECRQRLVCAALLACFCSDYRTILAHESAGPRGLTTGEVAVVRMRLHGMDQKEKRPPHEWGRRSRAARFASWCAVETTGGIQAASGAVPRNTDQFTSGRRSSQRTAPPVMRSISGQRSAGTGRTRLTH